MGGLGLIRGLLPFARLLQCLGRYGLSCPANGLDLQRTMLHIGHERIGFILGFRTRQDLAVFGNDAESARNALHAQMRRGASDEELMEFIRGVVAKKEERHHIGEADFVPASRTMVHIGG